MLLASAFRRKEFQTRARHLWRAILCKIKIHEQRTNDYCSCSWASIQKQSTRPRLPFVLDLLSYFLPFLYLFPILFCIVFLLCLFFVVFVSYCVPIVFVLVYYLFSMFLLWFTCFFEENSEKHKNKTKTKRKSFFHWKKKQQYKKIQKQYKWKVKIKINKNGEKMGNIFNEGLVMTLCTYCLTEMTWHSFLVAFPWLARNYLYSKYPGLFCCAGLCLCHMQPLLGFQSVNSYLLQCLFDKCCVLFFLWKCWCLS